MADIVSIHGMLMNRKSREEMAQRWHPAMVKGLENVRCHGARSVTVEYAFYGHLYNDGKAGGGPAYQLSDLETGLEQDLFVAIGAAAGHGDDIATPGKVWLPNVVQRAARRIEASGTLDGPVSRAIRLVKQVGRYLHDRRFADRVHDELAEAMATEPKVLVAHSLGSVIAYNWLRAQAPGRVPSLVTIGSPLGFRGIRLALHPDLDESPLPWPGVERWVNVAATEDAIAMVKCIDGMFDGKVHDEPASNTRRYAHSAVKYLENVNTADAIKEALSAGQP